MGVAQIGSAQVTSPLTGTDSKSVFTQGEKEQSPVVPLDSAHISEGCGSCSPEKDALIESLIDNTVQGAGRQALKKAFAFSDENKLKAVHDFGTRITIARGKAFGSGGYNLFTRQVTLSEKGLDDEKLIAHNANHEVLGHAWLAAHGFGSSSTLAVKAARLADSLSIILFGAMGFKKDVRGAKEMHSRYRDRVLVDKAVALRDAVIAIAACPSERIPAAELINTIQKSALNSGYVSFDAVLEKHPTLSKQEALNFISMMGQQAMGVSDIRFEPFKDGSVKVSFRDLSRKSYGVLLTKPLLMAGLGATLGIIAAPAAAVLGAGAAVAAGLALIPGPVSYCAGKAARDLYLRGPLGEKERVVELPGFSARLVQHRDSYQITIPLQAGQTGQQWTPMGFLSNSVEEYVAEGMARANESPESKSLLREKDPDLYGYLQARGNI